MNNSRVINYANGVLRVAAVEHDIRLDYYEDLQRVYAEVAADVWTAVGDLAALGWHEEAERVFWSAIGDELNVIDGVIAWDQDDRWTASVLTDEHQDPAALLAECIERAWG